MIREFRPDDLGAIVEFSLRAWEPVFASGRDVLGDDMFLRLHPDWKQDQADAVRSACTNEERDVLVAVTDERPIGFVAVALNAFHEGMGVIDIIGVDPDHQRRGISSRLTESAVEHMRSRGMDIARLSPGGDCRSTPFLGRDVAYCLRQFPAVTADVLDDARTLSVFPRRQLLHDPCAGFARPSERRVHVRYTYLDDVRHTAAAWRNSIGTRIGHDDSTI